MDAEMKRRDSESDKPSLIIPTCHSLDVQCQAPKSISSSKSLFSHLQNGNNKSFHIRQRL
jgi:hypothetical protein